VAGARGRLALGAGDEETRPDPSALEHVRPFQARDLGAAEARVEGDRVRHRVLGSESVEQLLGFRRECDPEPQLFVVGGSSTSRSGFRSACRRLGAMAQA
jgi:hypothetical protein